jgi:hypothetical protein
MEGHADDEGVRCPLADQRLDRLEACIALGRDRAQRLCRFQKGVACRDADAPEPEIESEEGLHAAGLGGSQGRRHA